MLVFTFCIGLLGAVVLVLGSAWPEGDADKPARSAKNWMFVLGTFTLTIYALFDYSMGNSVIFFVLLQAFASVAAILGVTKVSSRTATVITAIFGVFFIGLSLVIFEGIGTIIFVAGLMGIALGYVLPIGSVRRSLSLTLGGAFIVIFSYMESNWIFCVLNIFFAIFSGYYLVKSLKVKY